MTILCFTGFTSVPRFGGEGAKCPPLDFEPFNTTGLIGYYIANLYPEFTELIKITDQSWVERLGYWWENITVLIPDPQSQEWKDLGLMEEVHQKGCKQDNSKTLCPNITTFVKHHLVDGSLREGRKYKTKAGNKIWWNQIDGSQYFYPMAAKVLYRQEHVNGEMMMVEKPLWRS